MNIEVEGSFLKSRTNSTIIHDSQSILDVSDMRRSDVVVQRNDLQKVGAG